MLLHALEIALALNLSVFTISFRILKDDPNDLGLHLCLSDQMSMRAIESFCGAEEVFEKVLAAINTIKTNKSLKRLYIQKKCLPPSLLAKVSGLTSEQYKLRQNTLCNIFDHRPPGKKVHALHTSLQVPAFGTFIDVINTNEVESSTLGWQMVS